MVIIHFYLTPTISSFCACPAISLLRFHLTLQITFFLHLPPVRLDYFLFCIFVSNETYLDSSLIRERDKLNHRMARRRSMFVSGRVFAFFL